MAVINSYECPVGQLVLTFEVEQGKFLVALTGYGEGGKRKVVYGPIQGQQGVSDQYDVLRAEYAAREGEES